MTTDEMDARAFLCLVVFREARGEPEDAQAAVAFSVLNRVDRPKWWGHDVLEVVGKKWQYSSMTDPGDPQLTVWPSRNIPVWRKCRQVIDKVMNGQLKNQLPGADSYYDVSLKNNPPKWASGARFCGQIGRLLFYDVDHDYEHEKIIKEA